MVDVNKQREETDILIEKVGRESALAEEESSIANIEEEKTNVPLKPKRSLRKPRKLFLKPFLLSVKPKLPLIAWRSHTSLKWRTLVHPLLVSSSLLVSFLFFSVKVLLWMILMTRFGRRLLPSWTILKVSLIKLNLSMVKILNLTFSNKLTRLSKILLRNSMKRIWLVNLMLPQSFALGLSILSFSIKFSNKSSLFKMLKSKPLKLLKKRRRNSLLSSSVLLIWMLVSTH